MQGKPRVRVRESGRGGAERPEGRLGRRLTKGKFDRTMFRFPSLHHMVRSSTKESFHKATNESAVRSSVRERTGGQRKQRGAAEARAGSHSG